MYDYFAQLLDVCPENSISKTLMENRVVAVSIQIPCDTVYNSRTAKLNFFVEK